ncbi:unnamed protein product, partial [Staurois parvus]
TSRREGRRTTSVSDHLGDRSGSGSGYLSNSGTCPPAPQWCQSLLFLYPAARCLPGLCSAGTGHDSQVRMRKNRCFL